MNKPKPVLYYLRYLKPKEAGYGTLVHTVSWLSEEELTLDKYQEKHPDAFANVGFYTLMASTNDTVTIEPKKK